MLIPDMSTAQTVVANTELDFGTAMVVSTSGLAPNVYEYIATVDTWIKQATGAVVAAVGGAGSLFVPAKVAVRIDPLKGVNLSVIKDTAAVAGTATLVKLRSVR